MRHYILKGMTFIPDRGRVIHYDMVEDDGELMEDGCISVDFTWIKPCARSSYQYLWLPMTMVRDVDSPHYGQFLIFANGAFIYVDDSLIEWAKNIVFEDVFLDELGGPDAKHTK